MSKKKHPSINTYNILILEISLIFYLSIEKGLKKS